jgi:hypothetical protein
MFFQVINRKKVAKDECVIVSSVNNWLNIRVRSYRADNAVDDATIILPDFVLLVADSASPEGVVPGSLLGTWSDGFGIERPALRIDVSNR